MDMDIANQVPSQYSNQEFFMDSGLSPDSNQGWVSWAWSFVPAIVSAEEGEEDLYQQRETGNIPNNPQQHTPKDPIVSIGFYCTKASVTFKVIYLLQTWLLACFFLCVNKTISDILLFKI